LHSKPRKSWTLAEKSTVQRMRRQKTINIGCTVQSLERTSLSLIGLLGPALPCIHTQDGSRKLHRMNYRKTGMYHIDRVIIMPKWQCSQGMGQESTHTKKAFAFLPRIFFGGASFGSFCDAMVADTRARVA
jgi:hypothetical protein